MMCYITNIILIFWGQFVFMTIMETVNQIHVLPGHHLSECIAWPGWGKFWQHVWAKE